MALNEAFLPEFECEMTNTRRMLERVPEDKFDWKPHAKSFSMIQLASHLANIPAWMQFTFDSGSMDIMPGGVPLEPVAPAGSAAELLAQFDRNIEMARAALAGTSDEQLLAPWTLLSNGKTVFSIPRTAVVRGFILNHAIHHRAQLGMYLRLNDVPLPQIYGPTADESVM